MPATKKAFRLQPILASATPTLIVGPEAEDLERALYESIRERAYLLFEQSDRQPGNEGENWRRAESEVLRQGMEVRESGSWISIRAVLPEADDHDIKIAVRPTRVIVRARVSQNEAGVSADPGQSARPIFLATTLAVEVDPNSAAASFREGSLNLMVKKRQAARATV